MSKAAIASSFFVIHRDTSFFVENVLVDIVIQSSVTWRAPPPFYKRLQERTSDDSDGTEPHRFSSNVDVNVIYVVSDDTKRT